MQKERLTKEDVQEVKNALDTHRKKFREFVETFNQSNTPSEIDEMFNEWINSWLELDATVDRITRAHVLPYWKDQDLQPIREKIREIQVKISKMTDPERDVSIKRTVEALTNLKKDL